MIYDQLVVDSRCVTDWVIATIVLGVEEIELTWVGVLAR